MIVDRNRQILWMRNPPFLSSMRWTYSVSNRFIPRLINCLLRFSVSQCSRLQQGFTIAAATAAHQWALHPFLVRPICSCAFVSSRSWKVLLWRLESRQISLNLVEKCGFGGAGHDVEGLARRRGAGGGARRRRRVELVVVVLVVVILGCSGSWWAWKRFMASARSRTIWWQIFWETWAYLRRRKLGLGYVSLQTLARDARILCSLCVAVWNFFF